MPFDFTHDTIEDCLLGLHRTLTAAADDWDGDKHPADATTFVKTIRDICDYARGAFLKARFARNEIDEIYCGMDHVEEASTWDEAATAIRDTIHDSGIEELFVRWELTDAEAA